MLRQVILWSFCFSFLSSCGQVKFSGSTNSSEKPPTGPPVTPPVGPTGATRDVDSNLTVTPQNNKLDLLLVIDDSNSMLSDNQKLAQKLSNFVTSLQSSSIDWQMCVTVTRALTVEGKLTWGASVLWSEYTPGPSGQKWILRPTANLATVFSKTIDNINAGWIGTDDERGLKAAWWHVYNGDPKLSNTTGCYRADAAFATILISDEDERSVGGNKALEFYPGEYKVLENDDQPEALVNQVKSVFGDKKRFSFNSIIVKPGDNACMADQDSGGSAKSHFGTLYKQMSDLTGGGIGSICDADYSTNLNLFKGIIEDSIASFPLECVPTAGVTVAITPPFTMTYTLQGPSIIFEPKIPAGRQLNLKYKCPK